jgi:hypothetical protein
VWKSVADLDSYFRTKDSPCSRIAITVRADYNPSRSWIDSKLAAVFVKLVKLIVPLLAVLQRSPWGISVFYQAYLPWKILNIFFLSTEELLKSALFFSSFLQGSSAIYHAQFNQQIPQGKSRCRDAPPFSLGSSPFWLPQQPLTTIFLSPVQWRKHFWLLCFLLTALSLSLPRTTNVWNPGCLGNLEYFHIDLF